MDVKILLFGEDLQVDGRFTYTRQVGDIGDISTSNANYTNSFSLIRDNNSTRALKGLGLPSNTSNIPYIKFPGSLLVDQLTIIDGKGYAVISGSTLSNYKISVIDGNIDFWKAIEGLTLSDIDLSLADFAKTRNGIIESFESEYSKYIIGYYAKFQASRAAYDINLLNPAISDKYILDQIFERIGMGYSMSVDVDSWTVIWKDADRSRVDILNLVIELAFGNHPYNGIGYDIGVSLKEEYDVSTFDNITGKITITESGLFSGVVDFGKLHARYFINPPSGDVYFIDLPINNYLEVNGDRVNFNEEIYMQPSDDIYLRFRPLTNEQLAEHDIFNSEIVSFGDMYVEDYLFEFLRTEDVYYSFKKELGKISVKEFIKQIMHRYAFTIFYENRNVEFMTISERLNAEVIDINEYFVTEKDEKYSYISYAQRNILKMKYADEAENFNDGIIHSDNANLDYEKEIVSSFTFSQDLNGVMEMWEYKGQEESGVLNFDAIKGRFFSVRIDQRWDEIQLRNGVNPLPGYVGNIPFVDFSKTGFRYFKNEYYTEFENKILKRTKFRNVVLDMPLSVFMNLDLRKVYYLEQSKFLINKITYKGLREVEAEIVKING